MMWNQSSETLIQLIYNKNEYNLKFGILCLLKRIFIFDISRSSKNVLAF